MRVARIVIWAMVAVVLIAVLVIAIVGNKGENMFSFGFNEEEYKNVYEKSLDMTGLENLNINFRSATVRVHLTSEDDTNVKVIQKSRKELNAEEQVQLTKDSRTVSIVEGKKKFAFYFLSFSLNDSYVDIYLPKKMYQETYLKLSSGSMDMNEFSSNRLEIKLSSGNVHIQNTKTDNLIVDVTSGNIDMKDVTAKDFYIKASSGRINTDSITGLNGELKVTSGNIDMRNITVDKLKSDVSSGKIYLAGSMKKIELKATSGRIEVIDDVLPASLDVNTTSGNVSVTIPENDGFEVDYSITSGDFNTDFDIYSKVNDNGRKSGNGKYKDGGDLFRFKVTSGNVKLKKK